MLIIRIAWLLIIIIVACSSPNSTRSPFTIRQNSQGIELMENDHPVFFYQRQPKASAENKVYSNYLHPLYDLNGDTITEEFPEDHPYHRGIFWAWHQLYIHDKSIGDGWIMEDVDLEVVNLKTVLNREDAMLTANVLWESSNLENGKAFIEEQTKILVHRSQPGIRKIDFEISLKALVPGVELGGSADKKGYGGFCARIRLPKSLTFISSGGVVTPQEGQVIAGPWMDFSHYDSTRQKESGMAILCHPSTPNYPAPWILRQNGSMQNIVFPGTKRIVLLMDKAIVLRYRSIIHNGNPDKANVAVLQSEYEQQVFK